MKKTLIPIIALSLFMLSNCKEKQTDIPPLPNAEQKICSKAWKYKSITFSYPVLINNITTENGLIGYPCIKDDINTFYLDHTVLENDNIYFCGTDKIKIGNWNLINENQLIWDDQLYEIRLNNGVELVLFQGQTSETPAITTTLIL